MRRRVHDPLGEARTTRPALQLLDAAVPIDAQIQDLTPSGRFKT